MNSKILVKLRVFVPLWRLLLMVVNRNNFFLVVFSLILPQLTHSQHVLPFNAFKPGEKISYNVMYNLGLLWVNAGKVEFTVDSAHFNGVPAYLFKSSGSSYPEYDWVMKVRELFVSYTDYNSLKSYKYIRKSIEGSYFANETYIFDYKWNSIYSETENSKQKLIYDTLSLKPGVMDLLTAIYYCRNIDFEKYDINGQIPLYVVVDNKTELITIKYLGEDVYKLEKGKKINCLKFSVTLVQGTIFKSGDNMKILVTKDNLRIPVYVEADILIGTVKAFIQSFSYKQ